MKKIIVVKCGSSVVAQNGGVSAVVLERIARQVIEVQGKGYGVVIVSSGAVACGKGHVDGFDNSPVHQQVAAAYGQPVMVAAWTTAFAQHSCHKVAQCLVTRADCHRDTTVESIVNIIADGGVPVINENDAVSREELRAFRCGSDNDRLAALIACRLKAEKLIFLTDVDGVYCPNMFDGQERSVLVPVIAAITDEVIGWGGLLESDRPTGMTRKLYAARKATAQGISVWIANGGKEVIPAILNGGVAGTYCPALRRRQLPMDMLERRLIISVSVDDYRCRLPAAASVIAGLAHKGLRVVDIALVGSDAYILTIDYSYLENEDPYRIEERVLRRVASMFGQSFGIGMGAREPQDPYCMCGA